VKITDEQRAEILPILQMATQALIDKWEAEGAIEGVLGVTLDSMGDSLEGLAISYDSGDQVTLEDVDSYLDGCVSDEDLDGLLDDSYPL
jgi:hypothetical protein